MYFDVRCSHKIFKILTFLLSKYTQQVMQAQYMKKESLILGPKLLYLGISRLTFEQKTISTCEATSNFSNCKVS